MIAGHELTTCFLPRPVTTFLVVAAVGFLPLAAAELFLGAGSKSNSDPSSSISIIIESTVPASESSTSSRAFPFPLDLPWSPLFQYKYDAEESKVLVTLVLGPF